MILIAERLTITPVRVSEAPFYFELFNDRDWIRFIGDKNLHSIAETETYLAETLLPNFNTNGLGFFTVTLTESQVPIGVSTLIKRDNLDCIDIGYAFLPKGRGKGYATEATIRMMEYLHQELKITKVAAIAKPDNTPSIKLLENLGFIFNKRVNLFDEGEDNLFLYSF